MRAALVVTFALAGCPAPRPSGPPASGATAECVRFHAERVVVDQLAVCLEHKPGGVELIQHRYGPSYVRGRLDRWVANGPIEGNDRWGMHVRGWYREGERDGGWQFTDEHGVVRAEGAFLRDTRDGRWTIRYANGKLAGEVTWRYGMREGDALFGYPDGSPWWRGRYRGNKPVGTWTHWDRAGRRSEIDARRTSVGPLAEPTDWVIVGSNECPYENLGDLTLTLKKRGDVVATQGATPLIRDTDGRWLSEGDVFTYTLADGFVLGTIRRAGGEGEIVDENGEVVMREAGSDLECRDEGGRRVGALVPPTRSGTVER